MIERNPTKERNRASILKRDGTPTWTPQRKALRPDLFREKKPNSEIMPLNERERAAVQTNVIARIGDFDERNALIKKEGVDGNDYRRPSPWRRFLDFLEI